MMPSRPSTWRVPLLLVGLSAVPVIAGAVRVAGLAAPSAVTEDNARFVAAPLPIVLHFVAAALYSMLGAFQFSAGVRRRWPRWHGRAGRVLGAAGLVVGLTGTWMVATYDVPVRLQGPLLLAARWVVGPAMVVAIVLGVLAILRRDIAAHEAWMIRAYALGQGAGTQVLLLGLPAVFLGELLGFPRDLLMTLAWAVNVAVGEWLIRRNRPRAVTGLAAVSQPG